jgi:hypothetical protein
MARRTAKLNPTAPETSLIHTRTFPHLPGAIASIPSFSSLVYQSRLFEAEKPAVAALPTKNVAANTRPRPRNTAAKNSSAR